VKDLRDRSQRSAERAQVAQAIEQNLAQERAV
jgi:hypothetical protein